MTVCAEAGLGMLQKCPWQITKPQPPEHYNNINHQHEVERNLKNIVRAADMRRGGHTHSTITHAVIPHHKSSFTKRATVQLILSRQEGGYNSFQTAQAISID